MNAGAAGQAVVGAVLCGALAYLTVRVLIAPVWAWLVMRDASEIWERSTDDAQEVYLASPHMNRSLESALPQLRGDYDECRAFALDAEREA